MTLRICLLVLLLLSWSLGSALARADRALAPGLVRELFGNPRFEAVYTTSICAEPVVAGEEHGNDWALRFRGQLRPRTSGEHEFRLEADTGVRLWVGERQIVDGWSLDGARTGRAMLRAGGPVILRIEYFFARNEGGQTPSLRLYWTPPDGAEERVPTEAFGLPDAPITVLGDEQSRVDLSLPDGGLPPVPGVLNLQVMRATRDQPGLADGGGWTYAHHMDLAVWKGRMYAAWGMTPQDEDEPPYKVVYATSTDGLSWSPPADLFPRQWAWPCRFYFYRAGNGRMLAFCAGKVTEGAVREEAKNALLVREITPDHQLGEVYTLLGAQTGLPPWFEASYDPAFVAACRDARANRVLLEQHDYGRFLGDQRMKWHEEPPKYGGTYPFGKALCFYHRADGKLVGLSKMGFTIVSGDEGREWSEPIIPPTLTAGAAKVWGQRTADGRYALVYNPDPARGKRYPLVMVHGDDGQVFEDMRVVHGECPPKRYVGLYKDIGYQYVRGLAEWSDDGTFVDRDALWLIYSVHKEDIWVARVPLHGEAGGGSDVEDDFRHSTPGGVVPAWNLYCPKWAPIRVVEESGRPANRCLELQDADPVDYARAVRVFRPGRAVDVRLRVRVLQGGTPLEIELTDRSGKRPVRVSLTESAHIVAADGGQAADLGPFRSGAWFELHIRADARIGAYRLGLDGADAVRLRFAEPSGALHRLSVRTGPWRGLGGEAPVAPGSDVRAPVPAVFQVDDVSIRTLRAE